MLNPPLNVGYWSSLYPIYTEYADEYEAAMMNSRLVDLAESFWEWKGLNRSIPFEDIKPLLAELDEHKYLSQGQKEAAESLSNHLRQEGVVESNSIVTVAFLLHLMASGPNQYSERFPIYDRRVWNAYVYFWERDDRDQLYRNASQSAAKYDMFCKTFQQTCPDGGARDYERALFMFGRFIMKLPPKDSPTLINEVDEALQNQEKALADEYDRSGYALIDTDVFSNPAQ